MLNIKWKLEREHTIEIDKRIKKFVQNDPFNMKKSGLEEKASTHQLELESMPADQETIK